MTKRKSIRVGLFGISGVGKSDLGRRIVDVRPNVLHLEASALLKKAYRETGEALRTASAGVITTNQAVLAGMVDRAAAHRPLDPVLLDAHSVIDNDAGLVPVPYAAISPIGMSTFAFLMDDPAKIHMRRRNSSRKRPNRSIADLAEHQELACRICAGYAELSGGRFVLLNGADRLTTLTSVLEIIG